MMCFTGLTTSLSSGNLVVGDTLGFECRGQDCYNYNFDVFVDTINANEPREVTSCSLIDDAVLCCIISDIGPEYDNATIYCEATNLNAPTQRSELHRIHIQSKYTNLWGVHIYNV